MSIVERHLHPSRREVDREPDGIRNPSAANKSRVPV